MSKSKRYTQCVLCRKDTQKTAFIPADLAKLHSGVSLRDNHTGEWEDGWIVIHVGETVSESMKKERKMG